MSEVRTSQFQLPFESLMSGEHSIDNCSGNQPARCTNCSGSHEADSLDCPTYIKQVQRVQEARGLQAPTLRNPVSKNDG